MKRLRHVFAHPLVWGGILTLGYLIILARRPSEWFFGIPGEWTWPGRPPAPSTMARWPLAIGVLSLTVALGLLTEHMWPSLNRRAKMTALMALAGMVVINQVALRRIHYRYVIEYYLYRTIGPHNGFWQAAIAIESLGDFLRTFPEHMRVAGDAFGHLATHPPGNILYLYAWRRLFEAWPAAAHAVAHWLRAYNCHDLAFVTLEDAQIAAALGQMIVPLWSGLSLFPLYYWGKELGGPRTGWRSALLFALTPALSIFTMRWDTAYPLLAATAFACLHHGLRVKKAAWWFASGAMASIASYCSLGNAPLAPALALYALLYLWVEGDIRMSHLWPHWLALIAGGYSVWAINQSVSGVSPWQILAVTHGVQNRLRNAYSWNRWLFLNLYDFFVFAGLGASVPFGTQVVSTWSAVLHRRATVQGIPAMVTSVALLALDLAGLSPGEVGRLWMWWMVPLTVTVALRWTSPPEGHRGNRLAWAAVLLTIQIFAMTLFLRVSPTGMPGYQPETFDPPPANLEMATRTRITFNNLIDLIGYDLKTTTSEDQTWLTISLYWQASTRPDLPYTVFVHAVNAHGRLVSQDDAMPAQGASPTSCWLPREVIEDTHRLPLPKDAYELHVGLYYYPTMERLRVTAGGGGTYAILPLER